MKNNPIANYVRYKRKDLGMTQKDLSDKSGLGLRFIHDLEQGKETLMMDKVNQVLALFGSVLKPKTDKNIDPYFILLRYLNKPVVITMKNKIKLKGILVDYEIEDGEFFHWKGKWKNSEWEVEHSSIAGINDYI